ncbi:TrAP protein [Lindernia anagallis yellow vein virus]|uniref:Transcriptional activator protein n=1 Tax=Lindernia anagallis yellow vein virus TaxID=300411 RepID=A5H1A6_9GEMI|nr:TrAP protein [Lindernia anagallis yellow vein virus]ABG26068.1 TrAP protein [Lindernia anagallis yellow vein virus]
MQPSSPSRSHCTQVPIKVQHRAAKKKVIRRRRIDLTCGCTYYLSINCHDSGFTHRGTHHCSSSKEWRVYLDGSKSPLFQDNGIRGESISQAIQHSPLPNTVQPQPEESIGDTPMLPQLSGFDSLTSSDLAFLANI